MPEINVKIEDVIKKLDEEVKSIPKGEVFAEYLKSKCQDDEKLAENIIKEDKTLKGAIDFVTSQAKTKASNGFFMADDETVFKWVENYYGNENAVIEKKDVAAAAQMVKKGASTSITETPEKPQKKPKEEKKHKEEKKPDNGQMSLLDMM